MKKTTISEQWFRQFWQYQMLDGNALRTEDGAPVRVLYPGRLNDLRGPDFRDAVIETGNERRQGDIEIHLRSGDWRNHRHHLDRHYNRVILHVVMRRTGPRSTMLENGEVIPVLALGTPEVPVSKRMISRQPRPMPCSDAGTGNETARLIDYLDEAGTERFRVKAAALAKGIDSVGPAQTLYREMMEAMGYAANKKPFRELAERLPLREIGQAVPGNERDDTVIRACLFGSAGFLREAFQSRLATAGIDEIRLRAMTEYWQGSGRTVRVAPDRWQLFRIRPNNSPFVRLSAMSAILNRTGTDGFLRHLQAIIHNGITTADAKVIERALAALSVTPNCEPHNRAAVSLGPERTRAIVINVLLPFAFAVSGFGNKTVLETYRRCRKGEENSLERHMRKQFGLEKRDIRTAVQQQGLIHIYKTRCTQGTCDECAIRSLR